MIQISTDCNKMKVFISPRYTGEGTLLSMLGKSTLLLILLLMGIKKKAFTKLIVIYQGPGTVLICPLNILYLAQQLY